MDNITIDEVHIPNELIRHRQLTDKEIQEHVTGNIVQSFEREATIGGVLVTGKSRVWTQTRTLAIPRVTSDMIEFNLGDNYVTITVEDVPISVSSVSSFRQLNSWKVSTNELRKFAHDFTFDLLSSDTDDELKNHFPVINDNNDVLTPDLIINNGNSIVVLEFATTRGDGQHSLAGPYNTKSFKYREALMRRVREMRSQNRNDKRKIGFTPIICNSTSVMGASWLNLDVDTVNEICARFRFACCVLDIISVKGLKIEDDETTQMQTDIIELCSSIKPVWQKEDEARVPLTEERVMTNDIGYLDSIGFAEKTYLNIIISKLDKTIRKKNDSTYEEVHKEYNVNNTGNRLDMRAVLQLPGLMPTQGDEWMLTHIEGEGDEVDFLNDIISGTHTTEWDSEKTVDDLISDALEVHDKEKELVKRKERRTYKRVKARPSKDLEIEHATIGVQAKILSDDLEVINYRKEKQESFSMDVDTNDIEEYIMNNEMSLEYDFDSGSEDTDMVNRLIERAQNLQRDSLGSRLFARIKFALKTKLMRWCNFLSSIACELAISLKQNVNRDEWVVKKLKFWNCYLIIKPTRSDSHVFFQLIVPKEAKEVVPIGICKSYITLGNCIYYPFLSFTTAKLNNLLRADSFYLSMIAQWSRHYGMKFEDGMNNGQVHQMSRLCLLVNLEDKPRTEEIFTSMRYICMEKFSMVTPDNKKMISKLPTVLRSRFQVWAVKKMLLLMADPNYEPVVEEIGLDTEIKKDRQWLNMRNPYTGYDIKEPAQLVELFYIGYATNKMAKSWDNTDFNLVKKIVQYDKKLYEANPDYCGMEESPIKYKFHEWSRKVNCAAVDNMKCNLNKTYGGTYEERINKNISLRLSRITWDQLATLKASSTFDPAAEVEADKKGKVTTKRIKAAIAILQEMDQLNETPMLSIGLVLDWVDKDGGLRIDIFKKNQHGGLREIYVMEIHSRIIQLLLEEISRAVCEDLPMETMLHPQNKTRLPQDHMYRSSINESKYKMNISSSNDAMVWNQGHHVAKFAQFFVRLLPSKWHGVLVNGLKQWTKKRINLPDGVMNYLITKPFEQLRDDIHEEIRTTYLGKNPDNKWMKEGSNYLEVESGMMQGILHVMSSTIHCGLVMLRENCWARLSLKKSLTYSSTDLVSSDDTSRMTDVFDDSLDNFRQSVLLAKADHLMISDFSTYMGIHMSVKSTHACNGVMEFNSEFFFRANHYRPTLKWAFSSLSIIEVENMVERSEMMNNQITELLEGGSGFTQAYVTQIAQSIIHYRLLGSSVNPLFTQYCVKLLEMPDPSLGFFLLDPMVSCGLAGFSYLNWVAIKNCPPLSKLYSRLIGEKDMTTTSKGQITRGLQIRFGDRVKAKKILDTATEFDPEWKDSIEENPSVLYTAARTKKNSMLKILVMLTSPMVVQSLASGNGLSRMIASSVYLINGLSTTMGSNWLEIYSEDEKTDNRKRSLWYLLHELSIGEEGLTDNQIRIMFPHSDYYDNFYRMVEDVSKLVLVKHGSRRMLRSHVQVFPDAYKLPFSLEQIIKWKWFGISLPSSRRTLVQMWDSYKEDHSWLKETYTETLGDEDCPFENGIQMRNHIAKQSSRSRVVHLTGSTIRDVGTRDLLYTSLIYNQIPGYTLINEEDFTRTWTPRPTNSLQSDLATAMSFPLKFNDRVDLVQKTLLKHPQVWNGSNVRPAPRLVRLGVIQEFARLNELNIDQRNKDIRINSYLRNSKLGIVGGFTKIQTKEGDEWVGDGTWFGLIGTSTVEIHMRDNKLIKIITDSIPNLRMMESALSELMRELNIDEVVVSKGELYFDLTRIRHDKGCPIVTNTNMIARGYISMDKLYIRVTNKSLKLTHETYKGEEYTILSYYLRTSDYKFQLQEDVSPYYMSCWQNNRPLSDRYATKFLHGMRTDPTKFDKIHEEDFKEFVKVSLLISLSRSGWLLKKSFLNQIIGGKLALDDKPITHATDGGFDEDFDDFDFSTIVSDYGPVVDEDTLVEYDVHDIFLGEVYDPTLTKQIGDIRRIHTYWDGYAKHISKLISSRNKKLIETGYLPKNVSSIVLDFISNLKYYLGMEFEDSGDQDDDDSDDDAPDIDEDMAKDWGPKTESSKGSTSKEGPTTSESLNQVVLEYDPDDLARDEEESHNDRMLNDNSDYWDV